MSHNTRYIYLGLPRDGIEVVTSGLICVKYFTLQWHMFKCILQIYLYNVCCFLCGTDFPLPLPNTKVEDPPLFGCPRLLVQYVSATFHNWRLPKPSATRRRVISWWQDDVQAVFKINIFYLFILALTARSYRDWYIGVSSTDKLPRYTWT
jgi:hypothetical protein